MELFFITILPITAAKEMCETDHELGLILSLHAKITKDVVSLLCL